MRILYAALQYDYGDPARGYGFEHYNFYESLLNLGHDILYFDFGTLLRERGRDGMNRRLREVAHSEQPDLMFTVLMRNELDPTTVQEISTNTNTLTLNWFCDDHWRFDSFSRHWAPRFNWVVTTAKSALPKYRALGYQNVIKSQWGCNHIRYRPLNLTQQYDVSFVGLPHGDRPFVVETLRRAGIDVHVWGKGWGRGRISQDDMIRVFTQSRINLNLSNSSPPNSIAVRALDAATRVLETSPIAPSKRAWLARQLVPIRHRIAGWGGASATYPDQIKGRNFEIPACGGFLLTGRADNLEDYFVPGKEVACFAGVEDLVAQVRYYIAHPDERDAIASAGYERALREHTYARRFTDIFCRLGLPSASLADALANRVPLGRVEGIQ